MFVIQLVRAPELKDRMPPAWLGLGKTWVGEPWLARWIYTRETALVSCPRGAEVVDAPPLTEEMLRNLQERYHQLEERHKNVSARLARALHGVEES